MCKECYSEFIDVSFDSTYDHVENHFLKSTRYNIFGEIMYHCIAGPARIFTLDKTISFTEWYINGIYIPDVFSQKEFESSKEYRAWQLKAFS